MDFASLKDQVSNLSLYDLKAGVRKVQNAVMNYTEMEAKVREATNNEPWGASSTLMQDIANGTYSYQLLNEIMPMIYKRFTEKAAEEWRQIYKALQLLEFLIKNGSERVIDDARGHLSLLKMLRQFQYHDQNGKDQGINVRNRAKELADLLSDVDRIRAERKKARANRNKFGGVEGGAGSNAGMTSMSSSSRYGGFGSEDVSFGGYSGGVFGDGGGFGGNTGSGFEDSSRRDRFEEYDEGDDTSSSLPPRKMTATASTPSRRKSAEPKKAEPEVDLFEFGNDMPPMAPPKSATTGKQSAAQATLDDEDFDDFISAEPTSQSSVVMTPPSSTNTVTLTTQFAAPKPVSAAQGGNLKSIMDLSSFTPVLSNPAPTPASNFSPAHSLAQSSLSGPTQLHMQTQAPRSTGYQATTPNYFTSVPLAPSNTSLSNVGAPAARHGSIPSLGGNVAGAAKPATKTGGGADVFGALWSSASANAGIKKSPAVGGPNLASLAKEKASAGIWGTGSGSGSPAIGYSAPKMVPQQQQQQKQGGPKVGGGLDDLLG